MSANSARIKNMTNYERRISSSVGTRRASKNVRYMEVVLDTEDEKQIAKEEAKQKAEDADHEPAVEFSPAMRYSTAMNGRTISVLPTSNNDKTTGIVPVTGALLGERQISTNSKMNNTPAWKFALNKSAPNANKWKKGSQSHYEYCHLQGCALGGKTLAANLVAGHYALNTYMMVIEGVMQAKTQHSIRITAYCPMPDIADAVEYSVYKNTQTGPQHIWSIIIDGQITGFSSNDADQVKASMKAAGLK